MGDGIYAKLYGSFFDSAKCKNLVGLSVTKSLNTYMSYFLRLQRYFLPYISCFVKKIALNVKTVC